MKNSIEEDIEILEKNIKSVKENTDMAFFETDEDYYFFKAVEHILSDYKRALKENEELKNKIMEKDLEIIGTEEEIKANMREIIEQYYTANEDCVSKQKIKSKIIELKENINKNDIERYLSEDVLEILQELLESEE